MFIAKVPLWIYTVNFNFGDLHMEDPKFKLSTSIVLTIYTMNRQTVETGKIATLIMYTWPLTLLAWYRYFNMKWWDWTSFIGPNPSFWLYDEWTEIENKLLLIILKYVYSFMEILMQYTVNKVNNEINVM
jgi:hypothetical protein